MSISFNRRMLLRGAATAGVTAATAALLTACTAPGGSPPPTSTAPTPGATPMPSTTTSTRGSVLIAYFSRPGENYYYGDRRTLTVGNTEVLARLLTDRIDADVFQITARDPYPDSYDQTVARNVREQNADARPAIAGDLPSLARYDTILLGSPIWNVRPPMIMNTFTDGVDLTGKQVHPFVTYAVSNLGRTEEVYRSAARGARIGSGLAVLGETVRDSGAQANAWLQRIGLA